MAESASKKFQGSITAGQRKTGQEDYPSKKVVIKKTTERGSAPISGKQSSGVMNNSSRSSKKGY